MTLSLEEKAELVLLDRRMTLDAARSDYESFVSFAMPTFDWNFHHQIIAQRLSRLPYQKKRILLISVPAQTGKSELVSRKLPSWYLGVNPDARIILGSYGTEFAAGFNRANQKLIDSQDYRECFPNTYLNHRNVKTISGATKRTSDHFEIVGHEGFLRTVGHGAGSSGYPADLLIVDDPYPDMKSALSRTYRDRVQSWFTSVAIQRLSKNAHIIILHTRWHADDLIGWFQRSAKDFPELGKVEVLRFPSIADENLHPEDPRKPGQALWPSWKGDVDFLLAKKALLGDFMFDAMEQQTPPQIGGGLINVANFRFYTPADLPKDPDFVFDVWDCNLDPKANQDTDFVVGLQCVAKNGHLFIREMYRERYVFTHMVDAMLRMRSLHKGEATIIEDKAAGAPAIDSLKGQIKNLIAFSPKGSKIARVLAIQSDINTYKVHLPYGASWTEKFIEECKEFPGAEHDDCVDAMSMAFLYMKDPSQKSKISMTKLFDFYNTGG